MYILFGAGGYGKSCLKIMGRERIKFFVDNSPKRIGEVNGIPVYLFSEKMEEIRANEDDEIIISVSPKYESEIAAQLESLNIKNYKKWSVVQAEYIREKINRRHDYIGNHMKAIEWIHANTVSGKGIINNSSLRLPYPEVTGYYIPSLMRWGYRDIATSYAKWLCSIQKEDGSWYDTFDKAPYVFDTAQILKGLIAVREILPEVDAHIRRGCDWLLTNMNPDGQLTTPEKEAWEDARTCSELIHIYCLSPLRDAGRLFHDFRYEKCAYKCLCYYVENFRKEILNFSLLSHFYAYVMEGLIDMGMEDMARVAMNRIAELQKEDGSVPAYYDVNWVCSTGLFQFALVWFRLGDTCHGNRAFQYACKLQQESGGWYGSYTHSDFPNEHSTYFPDSEISWAVKYYLDALYYKNCVDFKRGAYRYIPYVSREDERYQIIRENVLKTATGKQSVNVLDVGCGKGRYLKNLVEDLPDNKYYAVDLYPDMVEIYLNGLEVKYAKGTMTDIPYDEKSFDLVYACESLCHAMDIEAAIRELVRVTKSEGKIIIVDKTKKLLGTMEIGAFEQWFDEEELRKEIGKYCSHVHVLNEVHYDGEDAFIKGLFTAWIGTVR